MKIDVLSPKNFRMIEEMPWETMASAPRNGSVFIIRTYPQDGSCGKVEPVFFVSENEVRLPDGSVMPVEGSRFLWVDEAQFSKVLEAVHADIETARDAAHNTDVMMASLVNEALLLSQEIFSIHHLAREEGGMSETLDKRLLAAKGRIVEIRDEGERIITRYKAFKSARDNK